MKVAIIRDSHGASYSNDPTEIKYFAHHIEVINRTVIGRNVLNGNLLFPHIIHDLPKGYGVEIREATPNEELYLKLSRASASDWEKFKNFLETIGFK